MTLEIKVELLRRSLTQRTVAHKLGISERYLSDIILGKRKAPKVRERLAKEYNLSPEVVGLSATSEAA